MQGNDQSISTAVEGASRKASRIDKDRWMEIVNELNARLDAVVVAEVGDSKLTIERIIAIASDIELEAYVRLSPKSTAEAPVVTVIAPVSKAYNAEAHRRLLAKLEDKLGATVIVDPRSVTQAFVLSAEGDDEIFHTVGQHLDQIDATQTKGKTGGGKERVQTAGNATQTPQDAPAECDPAAGIV